MTSALSDLDRIRAAFDAMTGPGLVALANVGYTQSDAQCSAVETLGGRGDDPQASSAIYWHAQSHDAFDENGTLIAHLALHWFGDRKRLARALREHCVGFVIDVPDDDDIAFGIDAPPVSVEDVDPHDSVVTNRWLEQIRRDHSHAWSDDPQGRAKIPEVLAHGDPRAVKLAFLLMRKSANRDEVATVMRRLDELVVAGRGESDINLMVSQTVGYVLDALLRLEETHYAATLSTWATHDEPAYRSGAAWHDGVDTALLCRLFADDDRIVRSTALGHLRCREPGGFGAVIRFAQSATPRERQNVVRMLEEARTWCPEVKALLSDPAYSARFVALCRT